jgi:hypothetical protein
MKNIVAGMVLVFIAGCEPRIHDNQRVAISTLIDSWHKAAADADSNAYFGSMAPGAIFMGTDDTEYWSREEFQIWARPFFKRGRAWNFKSIKRNIFFDDNGHTAWFDEKLETPNMGLCRGTGVVMLQNGRWMIKHYNLSIPIPNSLADSVVKQVRAERQKAGT